MNIVIIDSGVGAEEITKTLIKKDLSNNYTLLLDKSFFPYGNKSKEELKERFDYLLTKVDDNTQLLIIGCNTLSLVAPKNEKIIDMISITNEYLKKKKYQKLLLLATKYTVDNNPFDAQFSIVVSDLVKAIQENNYSYELNQIFNLIKDEYDAIILGCTHLIKVKNEFREKYNCDIISQDELIFLPQSSIKIKEV